MDNLSVHNKSKREIFKIKRNKEWRTYLDYRRHFVGSAINCIYSFSVRNHINAAYELTLSSIKRSGYIDSNWHKQ